MTHECRDRSRMLGAYLDGELETATLVELDEHLASCETCGERAQLLQAMRGSLKQVVWTAAPPGLHERIGNAMVAERARGDARTRAANDEAFGANWPVVNLPSLRTMVPIATAAALALIWGAATRSTQPSTTATRAGLGDDLLAELVAQH